MSRNMQRKQQRQDRKSMRVCTGLNALFIIFYGEKVALLDSSSLGDDLPSNVGDIVSVIPQAYPLCSSLMVSLAGGGIP